ncbi:hypothetical protein [Rosistilla oblonga]|uniref:hypothetical protein n=1 Tax=Rosistilla oblonga TaxID=2527990 RepID=UPI003A968B1B
MAPSHRALDHREVHDVHQQNGTTDTIRHDSCRGGVATPMGHVPNLREALGVHRQNDATDTTRHASCRGDGASPTGHVPNLREPHGVHRQNGTTDTSRHDSCRGDGASPTDHVPNLHEGHGVPRHRDATEAHLHLDGDVRLRIDPDDLNLRDSYRRADANPSRRVPDHHQGHGVRLHGAAAAPHLHLYGGVRLRIDPDDLNLRDSYRHADANPLRRVPDHHQGHDVRPRGVHPRGAAVAPHLHLDGDVRLPNHASELQHLRPVAGARQQDDVVERRRHDLDLRSERRLRTLSR